MLLSTRNVRPRKAAGFYAGDDVVDVHDASDDDFECLYDGVEVHDENGKRKRRDVETEDANVVSGVLNVEDITSEDVKRLKTYPSSGVALTDRDKQVIKTLRILPWEERKKFAARETLSKFMKTMKKNRTTRTTSELVLLYCTRLCESWGLVFLLPDKFDDDPTVLTKANIDTVDGKTKNLGRGFDHKIKIRVQNADTSATQDVKVSSIRSGASIVQTTAEKKASNARKSQAMTAIQKLDGTMQTVGEERARAVFEPIATGLGRVNGRVREYAVGDYQISVDTEPFLLNMWLTPDFVQRQFLGVAYKCFTKNKKGGASIKLDALETTLNLGITWGAQIDKEGKIRYFLVFPSYRAEDSPFKDYVLRLQEMKSIGITFDPKLQIKSDYQDAFKKFEVTEAEFYEKMKDSIQNPAKYGLQIHSWMTLNCTPEHCRNFDHKKERCYTKIFFEMCMQCGINVRFGKNHGKDDVHVSLDGGQTKMEVDLKFRGAGGQINIRGTQDKPYKFADDGRGVIFVVQPSSYKNADGLNTDPELYRDMTLFAVRPCDVTQDQLKSQMINKTDLDACRAKCSVTLDFKDIPKTKAGLERLIRHCM